MELQRGIHALNDMLMDIKPILKIDFAHCAGFLKDFKRNKQMNDDVQREIKDGTTLAQNSQNKHRPE